MRVLHFSQSLPGGPASYLEEIAPFQLDTFGADNVRFLLPAKDRDHVPSIPDQCFVGFNEDRRDITSLVRLRRHAIREIKSFEPDLIHLHSSFAGALLRPCLLGKMPRPRIVYCAHGWSFSQETSHFKRLIYMAVERLLAEFCDKIINISKSEQIAANSIGIDVGRSCLIRNGISELGERRGGHPEGERLSLLFVGRHDPQKGLDLALAAMRGLRRDDVHLHVLGAPVVSKPTDMGEIPTNVTFHGWASRERVQEFISRSDAVLMPSRWEGFGLVAVEAMRAGRAVIASKRGALTEIVTETTGYLFEPNNNHELQDIIESLDKTLLLRMGESARARYVAHFTSKSMNDAILAVYRDLVGRRDSHGEPRTSRQQSALQELA